MVPCPCQSYQKLVPAMLHEVNFFNKMCVFLHFMVGIALMFSKSYLVLVLVADVKVNYFDNICLVYYICQG